MGGRAQERGELIVQGCDPTSLAGRNFLGRMNWHRQQRNLWCGACQPCPEMVKGGEVIVVSLFTLSASLSQAAQAVSRKPRAKVEQGWGRQENRLWDCLFSMKLFWCFPFSIKLPEENPDEFSDLDLMSKCCFASFSSSSPFKYRSPKFWLLLVEDFPKGNYSLWPLGRALEQELPSQQLPPRVPCQGARWRWALIRSLQERGTERLGGGKNWERLSQLFLIPEEERLI